MESGVRFEQGTKLCNICKTPENIIQFEKDTVVKGLPVIEIMFLCLKCAKSNLYSEGKQDV